MSPSSTSASRRTASTGARPPRMGGFTLTELFAVVAIAAVLAAIAVPNLQEWVLNNARTTRVNELVLALNMARSEAIARRDTVIVCRAALPATTCAAADTWEDGFVLRRDVDDDGDTDGDEDLVRLFNPDAGDDISFLGEDAAGDPVVSVSYGPSGQLNSGQIGVRFVHCDQRGAESARAVILSASGQPRMSRDANGDKIHEVNGVDLTCP